MSPRDTDATPAAGPRRRQRGARVRRIGKFTVLAMLAAAAYLGTTLHDLRRTSVREVEPAPFDRPDPPGRSLEEMYAQADVVAQVEVVDARGWMVTVVPLAVFKSDGHPISLLKGPVTFCGETFSDGEIYLVIGTRPLGHPDQLDASQWRRGDEADALTRLRSDEGRALLARIEQLSTIAAYTGAPVRVVSRATKSDGCNIG